MVEAGANEVPEMEILDAIMFAHEEIKRIVDFINEIVAEIGKEKQNIELYHVPEEIETAVAEYAGGRMAQLELMLVVKEMRNEGMNVSDMHKYLKMNEYRVKKTVQHQGT